MNETKVSVIVPVYNAEKYLRQCLDSIVNQTLKEIEIICVNDGSTDSSPQILEEYAQKDKRIKIINKENEGLGTARKTGLDNADGDFILFVDSDDWIKLDACEKLYKNAISNNSDIIMLNVIFYDEYRNKYDYWEGFSIAKCFDSNIDFNNFVFNYTHIREHLLNRHFAAWLKMYKTKFLRSYGDFYFPKHVFYEDIPFHVQILLRASRISFCTDNLYVYRVSNGDSIMNTSSKSKRVFDIFTVVNEVEKILTENEKMDEFRHEFFIFKINQLVYWLDKCDKLIKKDFFELTKQSFENIDLKVEEIADLDKYAANRYQNIVNSDSYREVELLEKINQLKSTYDYKLQCQRDDYEEMIRVQREEYERKLSAQKNQYQKDLKVREQKIQDITLSNSWKMTKPIRKVGTVLRNLK